MDPSSVRPSSRRGRAAPFLVGLPVLLSGCSLFLSGPDPKRPLHARPSCSTNKGAVAVDGVMSGLLVAGGLSQLDNNSNTASAVPIAFGVAYAVAAVYGNSTVNACTEEIARFDRSEQPQLADGPPGAPIAPGAPGANAKARWSRDEMVRAVAAKKAVEAQEAAAQLGPPPMKQKVAPVRPPPSDPNGNTDAATEPQPPAPAPVTAPPPAKPAPPPKPSPPTPPPPATNRWDDFWKEQQP